jgi:hypothetical protein
MPRRLGVWLPCAQRRPAAGQLRHVARTHAPARPRLRAALAAEVVGNLKSTNDALASQPISSPDLTSHRQNPQSSIAPFQSSSSANPGGYASAMSSRPPSLVGRPSKHASSAARSATLSAAAASISSSVGALSCPPANVQCWNTNRPSAACCQRHAGRIEHGMRRFQSARDLLWRCSWDIEDQDHVRSKGVRWESEKDG